MTLLGQFALWAAFVVGLWCVVLSFSGKWQGRPELSRTIVRSVYAVCACLIVASISLWKGLITHDFNMEYVWAYTSRNLPSAVCRRGHVGGHHVLRERDALRRQPL
jgi:cytochrome c biogenesis factor